MPTSLAHFRTLAADEMGATSIEYGLLASLIAISAITALDSLGGTLAETYDNVANELSETNGGADEGPGVAPAESQPG